MTNKYVIRTNCLKEIRELRKKREKLTKQLIKVMEGKVTDPFLQKERIDKIKSALIKLRFKIIDLSFKLDRIMVGVEGDANKNKSESIKNHKIKRIGCRKDDGRLACQRHKISKRDGSASKRN